MELSNLYAVEALDGVGKTTVVDALQEKGFKILRTPPDSMRSYREVFEHEDLRIRFLYYLTGVIYAGLEAKDIEVGQQVITDRYLLTTVSAHQAMGLDETYITSFMPLINSIPIPEKTFILTCDEDERMRRMVMRPGGANKVDLANLVINDQIMNGYYKWSKRLGHKLVQIDTTQITPDLVVEEILRNING